MQQEKGLIHIYCGEGKGKTTAATGLAVRCAGAGGKVLFFQFLKGNHSSERLILKDIPMIRLLEGFEEMKFFRRMSEKEKIELKSFYQKKWLEICEECASGDYQMLVLDEIFAAVSYGLIEEEAVVQLITTREKSLEIVLTGRNPSEYVKMYADYITEMVKRKHPYDEGIMARKGIEY